MKPTPSNELIEVFVNTLTTLGGKAGNGKLQTTLSWNDQDYTWVRDHLIEEGRVKIGRGRGGSVHFVSEEEFNAAQAVFEAAASVPKERKPRKEKVAKAEKESDEELLPEPETIPLETVKARYTALPEDVEAFAPGMKVFRPLTKLFKDENYIWRNVPHYKVLKTDGDKIVVLSRDGQEYAVVPTGFYTRK